MTRSFVLPLFVCALALSGCTAQGETSQTEYRNNLTPGLQKIYDGLSDQRKQVLQCMEDQGHEVVIEYGGGFSAGQMPLEQSEIWLDAWSECEREAGYSEAGYTEEQLRTLYPLEVKNHECLLANGFPSDPPPSEQAYVDAWLAADPAIIPYQSIAAAAEAGQMIGAAARCRPPMWSL